MSDNVSLDTSKAGIEMNGKELPEISNFNFKVDIVNDDIGRNIPHQILNPIPNPIDFIESNHDKDYGAVKVSLPLPLPQLNDELIRVGSPNPVLQLPPHTGDISNGDSKLKTIDKFSHRITMTVKDKITKGILPNTGDFKIKTGVPCDIQVNYSIRNLTNAQYDGEGEVKKLSELFQKDYTNGIRRSIKEIEENFWKDLKSPVSTPITCFSTSLIQPPTLNEKIKKFLHPWNLRNVPYLPGSLCNNSTIKFNIGRTNDAQNWSIIENFGQNIKYQISGYKKWYIIPESEYDKFWNLVNLEVIVKSDKKEFVRLQHSNALFQSLIENTIHQDFTITPTILDANGIKYHTSIQSPGDYLIAYPKTIMFGVSLSFNVEQEVNVFTSLWSSYALDFIKNEGKHNEIFKIVLLSIQNGCDNLTDLYDELLTREIDLRSKVRELGIKELVNDNVPKISDNDLQYLYPSQILITDTTTSQQFRMSLESFLKLDINSSNYDRMKFELVVAYNDEKLKSFLKLSNNSNDYNKWIESYEKMMETSDHSLKTYKALYSDGEKIFNSLTSVKIFDHFQDNLGIQRSKDDDRWLSFLSHLDNLQKFIASSTKFIDDCQSILSLKHHQRIRGSGTNAVNIMNGFPDETAKTETDDDILSDPDVVLPKLSHLVSIVPKLNFNCSEIDLIIEFLNEIENFERSVRLLLLKENPTVNEFNELINLGKSFGINLLSLKFLIRVRNKLIWCKNFDIIVKGGEPTNQENKKEVFDLPNLKHFFNQGIDILSSDDSSKLEVIKKIVDNSETFNKKIDEFLEIKTVNETVIKDLDLLIDEIEDRYKLDNDNRIFAQLSRYDLLLDLRQLFEVFEKFFDFKNGEKLSFEELTKLRKLLLDTKLSSKDDIQYIDDLINVTKSSIDSIQQFFLVELRDTNSKKDNTLVQSVDTILLSMSSMDNEDSYEKSSSKAFIDGNESTDPRQIYCVCRNFELGTMIECESCKEWYHDSCVNKAAETVEPEVETKKPRKRRKKVEKDDKENVKMEVESDIKVDPEKNSGESDPATAVKETGNKLTTNSDQPVTEEVKSEEKPKPQSKPRSKDKKKRELPEEEDIFICPVCKLIESPQFVDERLSKNPTLLDLFALIQSLKSLSVQPTQELAKLTELQDKLVLLSQGYVRKISNIKSGDYNLIEKLDRLRFLLRKLYGYSVNIEDLFWECLTTIRRLEFEKHWKEKELKSKANAVQNEQHPIEPMDIDPTEEKNGTMANEINELIDTELLNLSKDDTFEEEPSAKSVNSIPANDEISTSNENGHTEVINDNPLVDGNVAQKPTHDDSMDSADLNGLENQYTHLPDYTYEAPSLTPSALSPSVTENGIIDSIDAVLEKPIPAEIKEENFIEDTNVSKEIVQMKEPDVSNLSSDNTIYNINASPEFEATHPETNNSQTFNEPLFEPSSFQESDTRSVTGSPVENPKLSIQSHSLDTKDLSNEKPSTEPILHEAQFTETQILPQTPVDNDKSEIIPPEEPQVPNVEIEKSHIQSEGPSTSSVDEIDQKSSPTNVESKDDVSSNQKDL